LYLDGTDEKAPKGMWCCLDAAETIKIGEFKSPPMNLSENDYLDMEMDGIFTALLQGDCRDRLADIETGSVSLIVTSPPYADQRKATYGGINPDQYVEWFLPIGLELKRVLRRDGTFILNIKEKTVDGERHTYVIDLIKALRKQGWLWTEEYIWHKKNSHPGKWPNRFRDGWERLLQFNISKKFLMNQEAVMIPVGDWSKTRLVHLSETDRRRDDSHVGSGFGKNISNWIGRDMVYPDNVLYLAPESGNKKHSAAFPESLPEWFIRLFTNSEDIVLDPFVGSGTTSVVSKKMGRSSIGIDILGEYISVAKERLELNE